MKRASKTASTDTHPHAGERRLPPLLRQSWYSLNQAFRQRIAHLGVTPDQFTVLRWLNEGPRTGMTQREICDCMASDPNTVTGLLQRMSRSGMIERTSDPADRRAKRTRLTAKGRRTFKAATPIATGLQNNVLWRLSAKQRDQFLGYLEIIAEACREELDEKP